MPILGYVAIGLTCFTGGLILGLLIYALCVVAGGVDYHIERMHENDTSEDAN